MERFVLTLVSKDTYKGECGQWEQMREMNGKNEEVARYEISRELFRFRMAEGMNVEDHVLKIINLINQLDSLGFCMNVDCK